MMKKKNKEQEVKTSEVTDKTTENKENTNSPDNNNSEASENLPAGGSAAEESEKTVEKNNDYDKVIREMKSIEEKLAEMQDKYLRLSAEFDNYRKRTLREKMDLSKYAGEKMLLELLPVIDDFERALQHMDISAETAPIKDGVDIIYGKLREFLKQNGVKEIETENSNFNVDVHEAVAKVPSDDPDKKGKIIDVVQKGYYLQDKVLRFAKVVVAE